MFQYDQSDANIPVLNNVEQKSNSSGKQVSICLLYTSKPVSEADRAGRKDLTNVKMVTIDSEDAKDLDLSLIHI